jgi:dipeptidase E
MENTRKIVAIGGGEIGHGGLPVETMAIDKEIVQLAQKKSPMLLFVPTASHDSSGYIEDVKKHFGKKLKCQVDTLFLFEKRPSSREMREKILNADIIYVGGGNAELMMRTWKKYGVDKLLRKAYAKGIVMSGISAGSMCWFTRGIYDSGSGYRGVAGLGLLKACHLPHYDNKKDASNHPQMMKKSPKDIIALENCTALEVIDDTFRIITSRSGANACRIFKRKGECHAVPIELNKRYSLLEDLFSRE